MKNIIKINSKINNKNQQKNFICVLLTIFLMNCFIVTVKAQEERYFPPALGLTFAYKGGVNGFTNPLGRKNGIALNNIPDAGITTYLPLDFIYNLGMYIDLMYNTNTFLMKYNYDGIEKKYANSDRMRFSYFSISPTFNHSGFNLGFNLGIPVSADWEGVIIANSKLNNLIEVRAGYSYPLYFDEVGRLNLFINASYALNGVYKNFVQDDPLKNTVPAYPPQIITNYYNPRPASIQIGVQFLFNLIRLPDEYYE